MLKTLLSIFALTVATTTFAFAETEEAAVTEETTTEEPKEACPELACDKCPKKCPVRK